MKKLSLCLIVKNEEKLLEKSLSSIASAVDEIVIADTGSTDKTLEIAKKFTDKIYHFDWIDDFSAARNFVQQFASFEYILRWDADCILRSGLENLIQLKYDNFFDNDIISLTWNIDFGKNNEPIRQVSSPFIYNKERFHWQSPIHNTLFPNDPNTNVKVLHALNIEIDHSKDPVTKSYRYEQTAKIIRSELEKDPQNIKLLFNEAENFIFLNRLEEADKNLRQVLDLIGKDDPKFILASEAFVKVLIDLRKYEEAEEFAGKISEETNDPRAVLSYADVLAIVKPDEAIKLYEKYLSSPYQKNLMEGPFNYERYMVHPYFVLGILYSSTNQTKMEEYFEKAHSLTKSSSTIELIKNLEPAYN